MMETFMRYSEVSAAWSAAIATTFAACIALWLGLGDRKKQAQDDKRFADALRSMVAAELSQLRFSLSLVPQLLRKIQADYFEQDDGKLNKTLIRQLATRISIPATTASHLVISRLPQEDVVVLTSLIAQTAKLQRALVNWVEQYELLASQNARAEKKVGTDASELDALIRRLDWVL